MADADARRLEVEAWLAASVLFRRLAEGDRARIAQLAELRSYRRGKAVFREGDPSRHFFTVVSGRVKVVKITPAGKEVILELFGPGDPLGAIAAYEGHPFPATAVATEAATCLVLPRDAFLALLEEHPSIARGLLAGMTMRLIQLTSRLADLAGGHVDARLARLLGKLSDEVGRSAPGGRLIPLRLTRQELADFVGTTAETAIRILGRWAKRGIVRTERGGGFLIADADALARIARGG
ncbi:MAG: Crp/Fnr family transcriptional regulator [Thermoanaerobaculia bacterium]|nr:Crp/Fnr family transcriptional regulator [Thermoanaerobaculia bacterium]